MPRAPAGQTSGASAPPRLGTTNAMTSDDAKPGRGSRRIVWRALRVGHVDDPRYEALTRQAADGNIRNVWLPVFFAVLLAIQLTLIVVRLARGADLSGTATIAASSVFLAVGLCLLWVARRRSKRYLADNGGPHQPETRR